MDGNATRDRHFDPFVTKGRSPYQYDNRCWVCWRWIGDVELGWKMICFLERNFARYFIHRLASGLPVWLQSSSVPNRALNVNWSMAAGKYLWQAESSDQDNATKVNDAQDLFYA